MSPNSQYRSEGTEQKLLIDHIESHVKEAEISLMI